MVSLTSMSGCAGDYFYTKPGEFNQVRILRIDLRLQNRTLLFAGVLLASDLNSDVDRYLERRPVMAKAV